MRTRLTAALLLAASMAFPPPVSAEDKTVPAIGDPSQAWDAAIIAVRIETPDLRRVVLGGRIDADYIVDILSGMTPQYPQPVILFLPDCGYRYNDPEARQQFKFMASLGYIVMAPDSFARDDRPRTCDVTERRFDPGAPHAIAHEWRREEARYALQQILALPWVDPGKIFVAGAGEGADAVLGFDSKLLAGRIAISPSCMFDAVPTRVPTLIIRSDRDVWYDADHWPAATTACDRVFGKDPTIEIATVSGALHDPLIYPDARTRFWNFVVRAAFF